MTEPDPLYACLLYTSILIYVKKDFVNKQIYLINHDKLPSKMMLEIYPII